MKGKKVYHIRPLHLFEIWVMRDPVTVDSREKKRSSIHLFAMKGKLTGSIAKIDVSRFMVLESIEFFFFLFVCFFGVQMVLTLLTGR